jgi:hypothetical protein
MLKLTITARDGAKKQITLSIPSVMPRSTSAVYNNVGTVDPPGTVVPAGSIAGYVTVQPTTWRGAVSLSDSRFVAADSNNNVHTILTSAPLPARMVYSMTMTTTP